MKTNNEFTTEKSKRSDEYLIGHTDRAITELVQPKKHLLKAYNLYNGVRDANQFRHLEENYGLGNPTSIEFTPLIKKHIDALIGEFLEIPLMPKVSCKDNESLSQIFREKQLDIYNKVFKYLQVKVNNSISDILSSQKGQDLAIQQEVEDLIDDLDRNFISEFEIAAQNVLDYLIQSRTTDLMNKLKNLLLDLLIAGMSFYRIKSSASGNNVEIDILNPLSTFVDYNKNSPYVKNKCTRAVVVDYMTRAEILYEYGKDLSKEDIEKLKDKMNYYTNGHYSQYVRTTSNTPMGYPENDGLLAYREVSPLRPWEDGEGRHYNSGNLIPVYKVEWIDSNKIENKNYRLDRYETIRIGTDIYILKGKSENVIRSKDNPDFCGLSINGIFFQDRNSKPFSLMLACAHLQDQYDIIHFFRNTLLANSGVSGDFLDMPQLPTFLGADPIERLEKWIAYKKQGLALIDSSQEGRAFNNNTVYAGFDDTLKAQAVQALDLCIERTESTASSITGVFRERLNGINQKDAVSNVAVGVRNSFTVTKQYYFQMDLLVTEILTDALDQGKIVYKDGLTGILILGDKSRKMFTALPEHFTMTDYDVHIPSSTEVLKQMEKIELWALELVKGGQLDTEIVMEVVTSRNLTELKANVNKAVKKLKKENNVLQELQKQNQEMQNAIAQYEQKIKEYEQRLSKINEKELEIKEKEMFLVDKRENKKIKNDKELKLEEFRLKEKQIEAEVLQLVDNNKRNDEIKNIV